ncbi:MAG: M23 family metallopeptidase [Candidatus Margulisiibacteriota bacterium]|jgi:hypothetical protein
MRIGSKKYLVVLFLLLARNVCAAEYPFSNVLPIEYSSDKLIENRYISHNFGEYRSKSYIHDGTDFRIFETNHSNLYPIAAGTAYVYPDLTRKVLKSAIPMADSAAVKGLFIDYNQVTPIFKASTAPASIEACSASEGTKAILRKGIIGEKTGWGNCVIVNHDTYQTRYAHLTCAYVSDGQPVNASTVLGLSGNTGKSEGEHLHFGILNYGVIISIRRA